ncbi:MAG: hypothetical protein CMK83_00375 [Pseudomonadales bacterium]|nr:hypothetical protein [Pseudomonadales bacterium]
MVPNSNEATPSSSDEDEPVPASKKGDFSSVVGNGGEVDSEDDAPPTQKEAPAEETPKASTDENEESFKADENVKLLTALQDPDSRHKLTARLDAPDVVSAEEESRRNAVDVDGGAPNGGKAPSRQAEPVPATVDPALASSDIAIIKTSGPGWEWSKIDMSVMEHGVPPQAEDARTPIVVDMALLRRSGGSRCKEQDKFASIYSNGSRMIAQAIILRVNQPDADDTAKPKKLLIVPVNISDPPQDDKDDIKGYATMMAIEPDVVRKLYMRDTPPRVLPSDFHPDQVDYVSLQTPHDFAKLVANHPKWSTLVSKKQSRAKSSGKRNKGSSDPQEPSQKTDASEAEDAPPTKKSKPEAQRTMTEFVATGSTCGTQDGATVSPVASPSKQKEIKKTTFRVVSPGNLAYVPVKLEALPEGTTELEITIAYITN